MAAIDYIANGNGYLYVVATDGTTVLQSIQNTVDGASRVRQIGSYVSAIGANLPSYGIIAVTSVDAGGGDVDTLTVNGVAIIGSPVTITAGDTASVVALNVANAINAYTPLSGPKYLARNSGTKIYLYAPIEQASTPNGYAIVISGDGASTYSTTAFSGGVTSSSNIYDTKIGRRFFINANFDASGCACGESAGPGDLTNAIEITEYIIVTGINGSLQRETATIDSVGAISNTTRYGVLTVVDVDTNSGAATDNLDNIFYAAADGDILIIKEGSGNTITIRHNEGNIRLAGAANKTIDADSYDAIFLQYNAENAYWEEISGKNAMPSVATARAAGQPWLTPTLYGTASITAANNTTVTYTVNTDNRIIDITGTLTLSSGNFAVAFSTSGAIKGDTFIVRYNANITIGAYQVTIGGKALTAHESLKGGLILEIEFNGTSWDVSILYSFDSGYRIGTDDILDANVTVPKLESDLQIEDRDLPVSFETDEVGDMKIKMGYPGAVSLVTAYVTKAIAATDDATIVCKDNAAASMGTITLTASSAIGTAFTLTPSSNNTFVAGDVLTFTTAKSTKGGKAHLSIKITRS
jgi:hypothetical protein